MTRKSYLCFTVALFLLLLSSCHSKPKQYKIGVSQCLNDAWRQTMNDEMDRELTFHPEMQLQTRVANGSNELQCAQIDSFIAEGVDLLIVSPNEAQAVRPAISRAYRAGIPVVVADRRVDGDEWTAFIGGDNLQVGQLLGRRLCSLAEERQDTIYVYEVTGIKGSTPARLRHIGLLETIQNDPLVHYVGYTGGRWFEQPAYEAVDSVFSVHDKIDVIVAQNDLMAMGAREAANKHGRDIYIMGVDALSGAHGGLQAIQDGIIDASATYYSRGDLIIQCAHQILNGEPFVRDTVLPTDLIDAETAGLALRAAHQIDHEIETIRELRRRTIQLGNENELQRMLFQALVVLFILAVVLSIVVGWAVRYRRRAQAEREQKEQQLRHQKEQLQAMTEELSQVKANIGEEARFMQKLQTEIEKHLSNPDMDVERLSDKVGVSRTSLYRKIKAATGYSPTDLLRHIRLEKARKLIRETDLSIQQITYDVGFSSPSYFTKCYRQMYGISPKEEERKKS